MKNTNFLIRDLEERMKENPHAGTCLACDNDQDVKESDSVGEKCERCGASAVCGLEILHDFLQVGQILFP